MVTWVDETEAERTARTQRLRALRESGGVRLGEETRDVCGRTAPSVVKWAQLMPWYEIVRSSCLIYFNRLLSKIVFGGMLIKTEWMHRS